MLNKIKNNLKNKYSRHKLSRAKTEALNSIGIKIILENNSDYERYKKARDKFFMLSDKNKLRFIQKRMKSNNR